MRFAYEDSRTQKALAVDHACASHKKLSSPAFFFHGRGSQLQQSLEGLLCTVIYRILTDVKALQKAVLSKVLKSLESGSESESESESEIVWDSIL